MTNEPYLKQIGAGTREPASEINLDVRGTVGPDYLGQETVTVRGHPNDRPGVKYRGPENNPTMTYEIGGETRTEPTHEVARMDTGEELPVLLESSMRADPIEATQGSYSEIVEGQCVRCGYDRLVHSAHTMMDAHRTTCNACGAIQGEGGENGYRMPELPRERAKSERESGEKLVELLTRDVYDMEETTGMGPYISIVDDTDITRLRKDDVEKLYWALIHNHDVHLLESIKAEYSSAMQAGLAAALLPDGWTIRKVDEDEDGGER